MANGAGFWMGVHQILLDVSIAPSYIKFGLNGGIQHPLLKIIEKDFFFKRYTQLDLKFVLYPPPSHPVTQARFVMGSGRV